MKKLFSLCIPVYNNEKNLPVTIPYIIDHLSLFSKYDVEIVMVNDGSADESYRVMQEFQRKYPDLIRIATLTRNFGQGACTHCCYELARGDVVGTISADMQEPIELLADMLAEWEKGCRLVIAAREGRKDKGLSILFSKLLHHFIHRYVEPRYPQGGFDFLVMDREVLDKYLKLDRTDALGQLKLLWLGYDYKIVPYTRRAREIGSSGWRLSRRIKVAVDTLVYFTPMPIHIITMLGAVLAGVSVVAALIGVILSAAHAAAVSGLFYVAMLVLCGIGIDLGATGIVGEYVWAAFQLSKQLPRCVIDERSSQKNE